MRMLEKMMMALLLFFCICFCSCEKEEQPQGGKMLRLQLTMPESIHVDTKVVTDAPPVPTLGGITINNVWIVQFKVNDDGTSGNCLKALYVPQNSISQDTNLGGLVVNLKTGGDGADKTTEFSYEKSRFYVIANGKKNMFTTESTDELMYSLTPTELSALTEKILKEKTVLIKKDTDPLETTSPTLLTSNPFDYTPTEEEGGVIKVRTQMFRAFAKIKVTIESPAPGLFSLDELEGASGTTYVNIGYLPKKMATYRAAGASGTTYPLLEDVLEGPFKLTSSSQLSKDKRSIELSFFMAENLRGIGTSTTQQGKNKAENAPGKSLTGCTYIELSGTYRYYSGSAQAGDDGHEDGVKVKYRFYLGGNFTNDYNIARDYSYELTFNIAGPNSADVRVQITDGNAAVFDEVHVVDNIEVNF